MLDLYTPSTEQFIADYNTRTDRLESHHTLRIYVTSILSISLILIAITGILFARPPKDNSSVAHAVSTGIVLKNSQTPAQSTLNASTPSSLLTVDTITKQGQSRFPGDPNPTVTGKAYWGSSIGGNGDPTRHETPTEVSLSVRRTFWQWSNVVNTNSSMYRTVQADIKANRLPFISIKTPGWRALANGTYDKQLDMMLAELDSYGKPVWLVVHHEPEGGGGSNTADDPGGPAAWRAMQIRVRQRMDALGTKNIAFMPVLMSYTWNPKSGRTPNDWWVPGIWDAYIVDHYRDNTDGNMFTSGQWDNFATWAEAKGMPYGTGEWGNRGTWEKAATEMTNFWEWSFKNKKDVIVYSYFDSGLNSPSGSWSLAGEPLRVFRDILKNDPRVQRINNL